MRNRGWELDFVYGTQVTKDFSFSIHGGLSHNENKIEELFGGPYDNGSKIHKEGYALNSFYVYPTQGLLQEDDFVIDTNGDLVPKEGIVFLTDRSRVISIILITMEMVKLRLKIV